MRLSKDMAYRFGLWSYDRTGNEAYEVQRI